MGNGHMLAGASALAKNTSAAEHPSPPDAEILRYLGYDGQALTGELSERIAGVCACCDAVARPASAWRSFAPASLHLPGTDIAHHLDGAVEVVLMAVTLGHGVDRELRRLSLTDPLEQVLFDAAATAAVERLADQTEARIREEAHERGLFCGWRFSPGYGDLPLDVQANLLARLDAMRRLGITLTPSNLMVPTKSVTAIIGIHRTPQSGLASSCDLCALRPHCGLRTRGTTCRG